MQARQGCGAQAHAGEHHAAERCCHGWRVLHAGRAMPGTLLLLLLLLMVLLLLLLLRLRFVLSLGMGLPGVCVVLLRRARFGVCRALLAVSTAAPSPRPRTRFVAPPVVIALLGCVAPLHVGCSAAGRLGGRRRAQTVVCV
jgi:hypothetical protein